MCGIVGYVGHRRAAPVIYECLKRLEYRGYDSAGIATAYGEMHINKSEGRLDRIKNVGSMPGRIGIGHTRWATHGPPSTPNAHPHTDCSGRIAIVHNGVIENYAELKRMLVRKGHRFSSETDSEIVVHLIEEKAEKQGVEEAVRSALSMLEGSYAIVVMHSGYEKLFFGRKYSPLVVGIGKNEMFCASDIPALLPYTNKYVVVEDGFFGYITDSEVYLEKEGKKVKPKIIRVGWSAEMAQKEGYPHFTIKEIHEQPRAIIETLGGEFEQGVELIKKFERLHIVGCGTAFHAGLIFRYLLHRYAKRQCDAFVASEYRHSYVPIDRKTLVFAISQSGETADTLLAVREAKGKGAKTMALVNVLGSSLTREADVVAYTHAGPEISVVSTKAFVAQVAALSYMAFRLSGHNYLIKELRKLPSDIGKVMALEKKMKALAKKYYRKNDFFFIGRGLSYPIALEAALKLKEISYAHAEAYPAGELKHGPLSLLEKDVVVIAIAPSDETKIKMVNNIKECKARGATVIVLSDSDDVFDGIDEFIELPRIKTALSPIPYIIPLQMFAYYTAVLRGNDPDKPRNLAKSVTVE
ncbi:MAG: glutamine--fructose-6-phosphate transaminase (isomerizing) [Candidatus Micrarchaeia archaeon]